MVPTSWSLIWQEVIRPLQALRTPISVHGSRLPACSPTRSSNSHGVRGANISGAACVRPRRVRRDRMAAPISDTLSRAGRLLIDRKVAFERLLAERIVVLDGAMGTLIQRRNLAEADYRGDRFGAH